MARFNIFSPGNAVRSFVSAPANVAILLSGCALMFLWPYYQRSFYRVTLFHRLGELSEPCYAAFLVLTAVAWAVAALWHNRLETIQRNHPHAVLGAALVSPIATLYLAGIVTPGTPVGTGTALAVTAALLYAACLFAVTAAGIACLMRCVYGSSLFMGTIVLIASNLAGRLVAPSSSLSSISTFAMPVFGIMAAGVCAFFAQRLQVKAKATEGGNYQPFGDAPYKGIWLAPLVAYLLLSTLHAITFLNDDTIEVHVVGATVSPAPFSPLSYATLTVFSLLFIAASVVALRPKVSPSKKTAFWIASIGMAIGLFCGVFLTLVTGSFDGKSETLPASDFTGSSMVLSSLIQIALLFMVYQNNLSPLTMFGAFFFEPYTLEKMLTYAVLPGVVPQSLLETLSEASGTANLVLSSLTFVVLILFLIGLCRDNALLMLFSKGGSNLISNDPEQEGHSPVTQATACRLIAQSEGLTPRETDILYALSLGHSAKHIGDELHISERTVQTHSLNIYRKLGVHTRQEVIDLVAHKRESADEGKPSNS